MMGFCNTRGECFSIPPPFFLENPFFLGEARPLEGRGAVIFRYFPRLLMHTEIKHNNKASDKHTHKVLVPRK